MLVEVESSTRERIAKCVIAEILKHGVDGVRLARIAKAAKVTSPLLHKYFGDRNAMIAEVLGARIEQDFVDDVENMRVLYLALIDGTNEIDAVWEISPKPEDPRRFERRWLRLEAKAVSRQIPELAERLRVGLSIYEKATCELIRLGRERSGNKSRVDERTLAWMLLSLADGFTNIDLNDGWVNNAQYRSLLATIFKAHVF